MRVCEPLASNILMNLTRSRLEVLVILHNAPRDDAEAHAALRLPLLGHRLANETHHLYSTHTYSAQQLSERHCSAEGTHWAVMALRV